MSEGHNKRGEGEEGRRGQSPDACSMCCMEEFQVKSFGLSVSNPGLLASCQGCSSNVYMVWRVFWAIYHVGWIVYDWTQEALFAPQPALWFIYLTSWSYLVLTITTVVQALSQVYVTCSHRQFKEGEPTPWYLKLGWMLNSVSCVAAIAITALYFIFLFDGSLTLLSGVEHVGNTLYVLLNLMVTAMPVRLLHAVYGMVYGTLYIAFSAIYWALGGMNENEDPYIYKPLNWNNPLLAGPLSVGLILVVLPVVQVLLWLLFHLRVCLWRCCGGCCCSDQGSNRIQGTIP